MRRNALLIHVYPASLRVETAPGQSFEVNLGKNFTNTGLFSLIAGNYTEERPATDTVLRRKKRRGVRKFAVRILSQKTRRWEITTTN